jgi:hypothetical protein
MGRMLATRPKHNMVFTPLPGQFHSTSFPRFPSYATLAAVLWRIQRLTYERCGEIKEALKQNAAAIIVAHNHPSGDPTLSFEDVAVTREIVDAGKLLGVDVLDHLVIGQGRWVSLRERGLGFGGGGRR